MAIISGHGGKITVTGSDTNVAAIRSWSVEQTQDTIETTSMSGDYDTALARTYVAGPHTWTLTADIYYDGSGSGVSDLQGAVSDITGLSIKLYPEDADSGNKYYHGDVVGTSFSISSSVDGMVEGSFSAQGTGALTFATA